MFNQFYKFNNSDKRAKSNTSFYPCQQSLNYCIDLANVLGHKVRFVWFDLSFQILMQESKTFAYVQSFLFLFADIVIPI